MAGRAPALLVYDSLADRPGFAVQIVATAMAGTAARPTVFGSRISLRRFAYAGLLRKTSNILAGLWTRHPPWTGLYAP